jgi:hypothetical protein
MNSGHRRLVAVLDQIALGKTISAESALTGSAPPERIKARRRCKYIKGLTKGESILYI